MTTTIQLVAGLANPGKKYENTRHNAGAWFLQRFAHLQHATFRTESKYLGSHAILKDPHTCHLLIPNTYMNLSGQSVSACMKYNKIEPSALLVAHDEIDLPAGVVRLKLDGGTGGHNGLSDIIDHLHTKQFFRLRIGVGHPGNSQEVADYVLNQPSKSDRVLIDEAIEKALSVMPLILNGDIQKAMNQLHSET